ncbi:MAG: radical SAM family heme chaperone HemW [Dehalococcoidia bacterium]|nr:radical SAM family heme chaperone HemW [Dehalococcoidia bacterium]
MTKSQRVRALSLDAGCGTPGLYVHIPFCASKCRYCDFNSYAGLNWLFARYVSALKQELVLWTEIAGGGNQGANLGTVYFGGGTPTLVGARHLIAVLDAARLAFTISADAEITVETNPGVAEPKDLDALIAAGVNRLSMGVQSFDETELRFLGRIHTVAQVGQAWSAARRSGFKNMSLDLMYGLPGQTLGLWSRNLDRALELEPEHLSLYALTVEDGTPLATSIAGGLVAEPDPDVAAEMYEVAEEALGATGYHHYEISNWAKPGRECLHNLNYWRNGDYVGVGAGAHSHIGGFRLSNHKPPLKYVGAIESGRVNENVIPDSIRKPGPGSAGELDSGFRRNDGTPQPDGVARRHQGGENLPSDSVVGTLTGKGLAVECVEAIDVRTAMAETMMLGLRLDEGVEGCDFKTRFGQSLEEVYGPQIEELKINGLLIAEGRSLRLTPRGRLLGNQVFCRFV